MTAHNECSADSLELKPCPFCGGQAGYYAAGEAVFKMNWTGHVCHCKNCQARVSTTAGMEAAAAMWNARALTSITAPAQQVVSSGDRMWCTACGTVTRDGICDCNRFPDGHEMRREPHLINYADAMQSDARELSCRVHVLETALREIRRYSDESLGPSRSSLLAKIAHAADVALEIAAQPPAAPVETRGNLAATKEEISAAKTLIGSHNGSSAGNMDQDLSGLVNILADPHGAEDFDGDEAAALRQTIQDALDALRRIRAVPQAVPVTTEALFNELGEPDHKLARWAHNASPFEMWSRESIEKAFAALSPSRSIPEGSK